MFGVAPVCSFCFVYTTLAQMTALGRSYRNANEAGTMCFLLPDVIAPSHEMGLRAAAAERHCPNAVSLGTLPNKTQSGEAQLRGTSPQHSGIYRQRRDWQAAGTAGEAPQYLESSAL